MRTEQLKALAAETVATIKNYTARELAPIRAKQASADELLVDAVERIEKLEARLTEIEARRG